MDSLDGRISFISGPVSDSRLADFVSSNPAHQGCLLLLVAVREGERNYVEATGNIAQFTAVNTHEVCHEPAAESFA